MYRAADENLILTFVESNQAKITIKVSKRIAKKAVDRNRIRRIIKEAIKRLKLEGELAIIVRRNLTNLKTQEVEQILNKLIGSKHNDSKVN